MAERTAPHADDTLRLVIDSIRDYAIFRLDVSGRVVSWNLGAQLIKGYVPEEIIGETIDRFYTPEDRTAGRPARLLRVARETGRVEDEGWRVRKDGTRFWADVIISAIRDRDNNHVGYAKITRDLSERRAHEEARLQDAARFRAIVESTRDYAIFALSPSGHVATWNPGAQRIKGYLAHEAIGRHFSMFYPPEVVATGHCDRELEVALRDGSIEDENWRLRKDGTQFWANVIITALFDGGGRHIGFSKITRDLTERRNFELGRIELAHANEAVRLRDEFLSIAAHELRTPLMAMQLQLDLVLEQGNTLAPRLLDKIQRASRNAQRLADLSAALLDVGRIVAGTITLNPTPTDVSALVHDVIDRLTEASAVAKCEVVMAIEPNLNAVVDALRIGQVVSNLLVNAFKYAAGTRVEVSLHTTTDGLALGVRDHGPGIAKEDRERIFARFERASARSLGGLGLGLYVAHQIVSAHGGSVAVEGAEGGGALFTVVLPLHTGAAPEAA